MGAWGIKNFENDDAMDWVCQLEASKGVTVLLQPLMMIDAEMEYLESPDCCEALAAAEIIKAFLLGSDKDIPEDAKKWLAQKQGLFGKQPKIDKTQAGLAQKVVEKILLNSELKELWEETSDMDSWLAVQSHLLDGLKTAK